jgi:ribonuclease HI
MSVVVYTDGGARGNPGPAAAGVVIQKDGETIATIGQFLGKTLTNNWAEYQALIIALQKLTSLGLTDETVEVRMDSELIVKQMRGEYRVKHADLKTLYLQVQELLDGLGTVRFVHIRREQNKEADALVNEALDAQ